MDLNQAMNLRQCQINLKQYSDWPNPHPTPNPFGLQTSPCYQENKNYFPVPINHKQPEGHMSQPYITMKHQQEQNILLDSSNSNQNKLNHLKQQQAQELQRNLTTRNPTPSYATYGSMPLNQTCAYNAQGEPVNQLNHSSLYQEKANKYAVLKASLIDPTPQSQPLLTDIYEQTSCFKVPQDNRLAPNALLKQQLQQRQKEILSDKQGIQSYQPSNVWSELKVAFPTGGR